MTIDEVQKEIDLSDEGYRFVSLIERENGEKTFLRTFYDSRKLPSEIEISAALKRVAMKLPGSGLFLIMEPVLFPEIVIGITLI
ncbi:MAG: hypothetical protein V8R91_15770 [Butyricimonas faecihominis]